jgi:hypothetical protein
MRVGFSPPWMPRDSIMQNVARENWRSLYFFSGLVVLFVLVIGVLILFPSLPDPTCASLIVGSEKEIPITLPATCDRVSAVDPDTMVKYLENERNRRGLTFSHWIICTEAPTGGFAFMDDPHWLPSYVPGTYQYRRTVVIVPYAQPIPKGSQVVGEVCLMPWRKYIRQIAGQCNGKFSAWK